jgi:hypothetical protein
LRKKEGIIAPLLAIGPIAIDILPVFENILQLATTTPRKLSKKSVLAPTSPLPTSTVQNLRSYTMTFQREPQAAYIYVTKE